MLGSNIIVDKNCLINNKKKGYIISNRQVLKN